jgi:formiminoglutamase
MEMGTADPTRLIQLPIQITNREGDPRLGNAIRYLKPDEDLSALTGYVESGTRIALIGIPESIGTMANYGKCCTDNAWKAFLTFFLNMPANRYVAGEKILCLGHIDTRRLMERARLFSIQDLDYYSQLRELCGQLDQQVAPVIEAVVKAGLIPIVIGGGHNNAYPIIKGTVQGLGLQDGLNVLNCDAHADLRPAEGRHSGNSFTYAESENLLRKYFVIGLHRPYAIDDTLASIEQHPQMAYSVYTPMRRMDEYIREGLKFLTAGNDPVGIELDLDSVRDMPASAVTPSGFSVDEVRRFVFRVAASVNAAYLHLPEAAPTEGTHEMTRVGKTLAYLVWDFIRATTVREKGGTND